MHEEQEKQPLAGEKAPEEKAAPLSEKQKTALLRYLAILFALAFLFVLLSMLIQSHNSRTALSELSNTSSAALSNAMANAEALQEQNRELQDETAALRGQLEQIEKLMDERDDQIAQLQQELEDQEDAATDADRDAAQQEQQLREAYDALITALTCTTREGNVTFSKAMDTVEEHYDLLSTTAKQAYDNLTQINE